MAHQNHTSACTHTSTHSAHFPIGAHAYLCGPRVLLEDLSTCLAALAAALLAAPPEAETALEALFHEQAERDGLDADEATELLLGLTLTDEDDCSVT